MSISTRRLLLLSSSALVALCFAGAASSQTPPTPSDTPPTTTPPASEAPASQGPQAAPEAPQAAPQTEPSVSIPTVTVTAPPPRPRTGTARPAAPARVTTPPPPTPTPTATPSATTAGQPAATSPFNQPPASLSTITSSQIQASPAQSFGNLFFTLPGATSAGLAPGASRPVLRGLDDFRVRVQENGIGSMDVSDLGQDHGVPIDPLSIQKIEIFRGPEALRYGSQAVGGVVEATNNRIPFAAPVGGWQAQILGATTTVDRGSRGRRLVRCRHPRFRDSRRLLRPSCQRLFRAELPLSFPDRPRAVLQRQAAELRLAFRGTGGGRLVPVRRRLCGRRDLALHQRLSDSHARWCPDKHPHRHGADQDHQQGRVSSAIVRDRRRALLAGRGRIPAPRVGIGRRRPRYRARDL